MILFPLINKANPRFVRDIQSLAAINGIEVTNGTIFDNLPLPSTVQATFTDSSTGPVAIDWLEGSYNAGVPGPVTLFGNLSLPGSISNSQELQAEIEVTVGAITDFSPAFNIGERAYAVRLYENTGHAWINSGQLWSDAFFYDEPTGLTHSLISRIPSAVPFGQVIDLVYNEHRGLDEEYVVGNVMSGAETHQYPAGCVTGDGNIHAVQENLHTTPLDKYTSNTPGDYTVFTKTAAAIGTLLAYANIYKNDDGSHAIWSRGKVGTDDYISFVTKGDANFTNWGAQLQITSLTVGQNFRHYTYKPMRQTVGGWHYVMWALRKDLLGEGIFSKILVAKTPSDGGADTFNKFYDLAGGNMLDRAALGRPFTGAEIIARYQAFDTGDPDLQGYIPTCCMDADGYFYSIQSKGIDTDYYFVYETSHGVFTNTLITGISDVVQRGLQEAGAYLFLVAYNRNDIRAYVQRYTGSGSLFHTWEVRTTNLGASWEILRDLTPDLPATEYATFFMPYNLFDIPADRNFMLMFVTSGNIIKVKPGAFGTVQPYAEPEIIPAADMTHASGLFNYKASAATLSGNTVTNLVDSFGLRNAAPAGSPQWDPAQEAIVLNGTNQYFNIATTGLLTLNAMTFIAVVKGGTGARIIFSVTVSSSNVRYYEFQCGAAGIWTLNNVLAGGSISVTGNTSSMNDSNFHILEFIVDGVRQVSIYIDGRKQKFVTSADDLAEWNIIGRGTSLITSTNSVNIGRRDASTDVFSAITFKELALYSSALPIATLQAKRQLLADTYGITLSTQFE